MKGLWFRVQGLEFQGFRVRIRRQSAMPCPHSIGFNRSYKCATVRECRLDENDFKMKGF